MVKAKSFITINAKQTTTIKILIYIPAISASGIQEFSLENSICNTQGQYGCATGRQDIKAISVLFEK